MGVEKDETVNRKPLEFLSVLSVYLSSLDILVDPLDGLLGPIGNTLVGGMLIKQFLLCIWGEVG